MPGLSNVIPNPLVGGTPTPSSPGMPGAFQQGSRLQNFMDPGDIFQNNPNSKFQKPQMPTPPNYQALIDEQAKMNRISQNTPFGSLSYTTDKNGNPIANYSLSPQYQKMSNLFMNRIIGAANGGATYDKKITRQYYNNAMGLLQPQLQQQQDQFTQNLADRGLPPGSQLYGSLSDQFNQDKNNQMLQVANDAISKGLAYGQQNQTRLQGLLGAFGQFTPGLNGFFSPSGVDVNGSASIAANAANQNYNALMQQYSGNLQGLYGLGSAGIAAFSDRRLKTDITRIGQTDDGIPLYSFRYKGETTFRIGPMADEVRKRQPDAVFTGPDGYDRVFYGKLH